MTELCFIFYCMSTTVFAQQRSEGDIIKLNLLCIEWFIANKVLLCEKIFYVQYLCIALLEHLAKQQIWFWPHILAFFIYTESAWSPLPLRNSFPTLPMTLCSIVRWKARLQVAQGVRQRSVFLWLVCWWIISSNEKIDRNFLIAKNLGDIK